MDEQQSLPPLEDYYTQVSRDALRTDESLGGVATAAEGFVSVVAPVREQQEDASVTEPVEEHRRPNVPTKRRVKRALFSTLALRSVPEKRKNLRSSIEKLSVRRVYADQPPSGTTTTDVAHVSESMKGHQWSASNMRCASDITIPRDNGTERGSPTTCPANITTRGQWNEIRDDRNSTILSGIGDNAGWGPPSSAIALPDSYMPADNSTGDPTADPWYLTPWAMEPCSSETLPASFWDWTWPQSGCLTGSETNGLSHPSIPASQAAGWPFGGEAEQPQQPSTSGVMPFWAYHSQELYPPGPSFDAPDPIPSSDALGLSSILETAPPSFPRFHHVQHVEEASLALPTEPPMLLPPWDPLARLSAALPMTDFHRHSLHQQPSAPVPVRYCQSLVPRWLQTMMNYQEAEVRPFDDFGASSLDLPRNVTVPEDQVEYCHTT
ncbi:hypothetical protein BDQ94DRAFT_175756 [Aspergillus welwitschiae]|uniref:Uncharacterized protein n=1 Tax=Aspergillus welwitschiae TaxID=1341132 RepID=A0A3F3PLQ6_9EURO|nr:hypothetical protein BDQ94DRAFT_175756 [Aspergillus welwitschiae]RDH27286.1 hypothetical protein BDQ94DRAFT_175756 [Aspergillus welwitschiae]